MYITFDTNIIVSDYNLSNPLVEVFFNNYDKCGYKLFISTVIIDEAVIKYKEAIEEFNNKNNSYFSIIPQPHLKRIEKLDIEEYAKKYRKHLEGIFFGKKFPGIVRPLSPSHVAIEKIYQRSLEKRKPFNNKGQGFKDALIWENILEMINTYYREDQKFIFITKNLKDFADEIQNEDGSYSIHKELYKDLTNINCPTDSLVIYNSMSSFFENELKKKLENIDLLINNSLFSETELLKLLNESIINNEVFINDTSENNELFKGFKSISKFFTAKIVGAYKSWVDQAKKIIITIDGTASVFYIDEDQTINKIVRYKIYSDYNENTSEIEIKNSEIVIENIK